MSAVVTGPISLCCVELLAVSFCFFANFLWWHEYKRTDEDTRKKARNQEGNAHTFVYIYTDRHTHKQACKPPKHASTWTSQIKHTVREMIYDEIRDLHFLSTCGGLNTDGTNRG